MLGSAGDRREAGVAGAPGAACEKAAVADFGEDAHAGGWADAGHGGRQPTERVGGEGIPDLGGEGLAAVSEPAGFAGELGDDAAEDGLARQGDRLGGQCLVDRGGDFAGHPRRDFGHCGVAPFGSGFAQRGGVG